MLISLIISVNCKNWWRGAEQETQGGECDGSWHTGSGKRNHEQQMNGNKLSRAVLKWHQWQSGGEHDEA